MVALLALVVVIYNRIMKRIETLILGILACAIWDVFTQSIASGKSLFLSFTTLLVTGLLVGIAIDEYIKKPISPAGVRLQSPFLW
jgi:cell shape-determining protein MreD